MTRTELIRATAKRAGVTQETAAAIIAAALDTAADALASGEPVKVQRFGILETRERKARTTHNFKTGEPMTIEARKVIAFTPSDELKDKVNA